MIVRGGVTGVCTTGCDTYYLRAAGMMGGEMIVVVNCRGEKAGDVLLRRTRRSTHNMKESAKMPSRI
jgi:hypothetical protein